MQFLTEKEILEGCAKSVIKAQEALFKKFGPQMKRICLRYSRNSEDANDIFQEGFIKVLKDIRTFRNDCPLDLWMRKIFVNTTVSFYRKNNLYHFSSLDSGNDDLKSEETGLDSYGLDKFSNENDQIDLVFSDYENAINLLNYEEIVLMIQLLPPPQNIIFNMFYVENYTHKDIATELKLTDGNCRILLHRAKKNLKEKIIATLSIETIRR